MRLNEKFRIYAMKNPVSEISLLRTGTCGYQYCRGKKIGRRPEAGMTDYSKKLILKLLIEDVTIWMNASRVKSLFSPQLTVPRSLPLAL